MSGKTDQWERRARKAAGARVDDTHLEREGKLLVRDVWLTVPLGAGVDRTSASWEIFSDNFDRCLRYVFQYVRRSVNDVQSLRRIITQVLVENVDLLNARYDEGVHRRRLDTSADRLIARESEAAGSSG